MGKNKSNRNIPKGILALKRHGFQPCPSVPIFKQYGAAVGRTFSGHRPRAVFNGYHILFVSLTTFIYPVKVTDVISLP